MIILISPCRASLSRGMSPTQLQDKRILVVTSISLEQQGEPQELEVCLAEVIIVRRQRRSTAVAWVEVESSWTHV